MNKVTQQNNFIYLTGSLIVLLLASAVIQSLPEGRSHLFLQSIVFITFAIGYRSLNFGPTWRPFMATLVILLIIANVLYELTDWAFYAFLDLVLMLLFFAGSAYRSGRQVLFSGTIDQNVITGSIAIFLLLGLTWASLYLIVLELSPTSFNGISHRDWVENFSVTTYFSYVTLTTLGYGEISPAEPLSRVLVYLEAITGVFYMAIVVASLVGARRSGKKD
jgi:voltage-gated potassium channel Kch